MTAQASRPPELGELDLRTPTPLQRALLVLDGTVTKFIEAYTMKPLDIVRLGSAVIAAVSYMVRSAGRNHHVLATGIDTRPL